MTKSDARTSTPYLLPSLERYVLNDGESELRR
jgi:hypothetical protein